MPSIGMCRLFLMSFFIPSSSQRVFFSVKQSAVEGLLPPRIVFVFFFCGRHRPAIKLSFNGRSIIWWIEMILSTSSMSNDSNRMPLVNLAIFCVLHLGLAINFGGHRLAIKSKVVDESRNLLCSTSEIEGLRL